MTPMRALARMMALGTALLVASAGLPAAAQQRHPDNTIPPEKIEPAPSPPRSEPGRETVQPPATGDREISRPPPADTHFPTPVLPPPAPTRP